MNQSDFEVAVDQLDVSYLDSNAESSISFTAPQEQTLNDKTRSFLQKLNEVVQSQNTENIFELYEHTFNKLSADLFSKSRWPESDSVREHFKDFEEIVFILYKELYHRHLYTYQLNPTAQDRLDSWNNYKELLDFFLENQTVELPKHWIFDILDEFVYQFEQCVRHLDSQEDVWSSVLVFKYLTRLVNKSAVNDYLLKVNDAKTMSDELKQMRCSTSLLFGYFSHVQLLRLHVLTGDYYSALKQLDNFDMNGNGIYLSVQACHLTCSYYRGIAYMMCRRYRDATQTFSNFLTVRERTRSSLSKSYQQANMDRMSDKMYNLLALCIQFNPEKVDELLANVLKSEKKDVWMSLVKTNDVDREIAFETAFTSSTPRYMYLRTLDEPVQKTQVSIFMEEVRQSLYTTTIRSFTQLYTALSIAKLTAFLKPMTVDDVRTLLLRTKYKSYQLVNNGGSSLEGVTRNVAELDFHLDGDMILVHQQKTDLNYVDIFIKQIIRQDDVYKSIT
eukprot:GHVL01036240.1.p1 GENE.GHVL01036240.1~~GHVL01036240.1.p1  ORF type:complete len:503 (-),score=62.23 GHVL01036240.1:256-1764(-)